MIKFDSIKLKLSLKSLDFDMSKYAKCIKEVPGNEQVKYSLLDKPLGISSIEIFPSSKEVLVQCSSKVLREDYLRGINSNTLERLHTEMRKYIDCSCDDVANSMLLRGDVTENLYFDSREEKEVAIKCLKLGKSNVGFIVDDYTDKRESIIFRGRQTSYKNRQLYYNKEKELLLSRNKEIAGLINWRTNKVDRILRVEQNVTSFSKLREATGKRNIPAWSPAYKDNINVVKLCEALVSKEKPLYKRHIKIMEFVNQVSLFDEYDDYATALKHIGWKGMLEQCNGSLELMLDFVKATTTRRSFYRIKKEILTYFSNNIVSLVPNLALCDEYFCVLKKIESMLLAS